MVQVLPRCEDDSETDDDLNMADELSQMDDAEEAIKLPNTPFPDGGVPITPWPDEE